MDDKPASEPALALFLLQQAARRGTLLAILRSAGRLERVGGLATAFAQGVEVLVLPPWDVLPYDRALPSASVVGRRVRTLAALAVPDGRGPRLVLTSADAALQRVRPPSVWQGAEMVLHPGDPLQLDTFRAALAERGYRWDERVDEPGEVALRGQVIDLFPAGNLQPARLELEAGRIVAIHRYDPATLRRGAARDDLVLRPAVEFPLDPEDLDDAEEALSEDGEDGAPPALVLPNRLVPVFGYLPGAAVYRDPEVGERWAAAREAIEDAYAASGKAARVAAQDGVLPRPRRLYLSVAEAEAAAGPGIAADDIEGEEIAAPRRIEDLLQAARSARQPAVVIATPAEPDRVAASLDKRGLPARVAADWAEATAGGVAVLQADLATGLATPDVLLLPIGPLLRPRASTQLAAADEAPRVGEIVVHLDHGVCRLSGLRALEQEDRVALEFADGAELLIPAEELDRVWRYGGEGGATLDRIGGEAWTRKRQEIEVEVARTAHQLAAAAAARAQASAPTIVPPQAAYAQVTRRFPYPPSQDQRAAIHDVQADLAAGHPMDRLLCGDVGFGKTEVAIRAAACAALSGLQVAVAAPTTVLARQHLDVFRRRFAGTGIRVEGLIRGAATPEGRSVKAAVKTGAVGIVVGTQGLAQLQFATLGLAIIDEEQRFGEGDKSRLAGMAPHVLAMTATPIPRTLQAALVGLRDVSVLATAPLNRQPTRTFVLPWDPVVVREALLREARRGGQSFLVCPRVADIAPLQARLAELVPELAVVIAHGRMKAEVLEAAVLDFAAGSGDVLLATNIIEAGLDIPRANLMLVTHADRFGLAQLHQLRGRVGRSARRGTAYLLTEPGRKLTAPTRRRLATMETLSGLGAGVAISAADLDLRGAGDLFGVEQAGHVRTMGTELYQHLLAEAVSMQKGGEQPPPAPDLRTGLTGRLPAEYVPEENLRIGLLRRLARLSDIPGLEEFAEELADRFGPVPEAAARLLDVQRLRILCRAQGVALVEAGPQACALTPARGVAVAALAASVDGTVKGERAVLPLAITDPAQRVAALTQALSQ